MTLSTADHALGQARQATRDALEPSRLARMEETVVLAGHGLAECPIPGTREWTREQVIQPRDPRGKVIIDCHETGIPRQA